MSSIDERVVNMRFNNSAFMNGVRGTIDALASLKSALNLTGATKGIEELDNAGKKFSLAGMSSGVDGISAKFAALAAVGITALANITNRAVDAGLRIGKSLSLQPLLDGFAEYELKMGSIQTILANTASKGTQLPEVVANLDELNAYADKTIYNFGQMTKNIGLFTNAGIGIGDATSMIKGFSNEAAASGTSAEGAASAAYQLSQALSAGKITLMDWRSLQNVGMGNANMKKGILEIAEAMGTLEGKAVTAEDIQTDFNGSLEKGWLTADVMSNYLKIMAGDMDEATQKSLGLTDAQVEGFAKQQAMAEDAATKVRTFTQLVGTIKEGIGSSWAQTMDLLIGDFDQATELWTGVNDTLGTMIGKSGEARNALLKGWTDLGGRDVAIEAIKNGFKALMDILTPVKEAFREIFPPATAQQLFNITAAIRDFTANLIIGGNTGELIKRTFKGIFAIFDIGIMIIKAALGMFSELFGGMGDGEEVFLSVTARIGDMIVSFRDSLKAGQGLVVFFSKVGTVLHFIIGVIQAVAGSIADLFSGGGEGSGGLETSIERIHKRFEPLEALLGVLVSGWGKLGTLFTKAWDLFKPMAAAMADFFSGLGTAIGEAVSGMDFTSMLDTINTGLFAALVLMLKKFLSGGINIDAGGGFFDSIKETLGGVTDTLSAMQAQLKAGALLKIAGAIAVLAAALVILALIDPAKLATALGGITVMFAQLAGALVLFNNAVGIMGTLKLPILAAGLLLLGGAMLIFAVAVKMLSDLSWEELAKGLSAVIVLLGALAGTAKLLSGSEGGMLRAGAALLLVAVAVRILAGAVEQFAGMSWEELAKGLAGVAATLLALGLFTKLADTGKGAFASSAGLILLAIALKIMASAVGDFADMDWETLGRGFAGMAVSLGLIVGAMNLMPKDMLAKSAALMIVAAALVVLAQALGTLGGMSMEELAKGLGTLAISLGLIALAMKAMTGALPGAAALLVVAAALAILSPVLQALGGMTWEEIAKGMVVLAGTFIILGVAGAVLGPVIPIILGLAAALALIGVAVALVGAGVALAGIGVLAFAAGLVALGAASAVGVAAIVALVSAVIALIPLAMTALAQGIVAFVEVLIGAAPTFLVAMVMLITTLLKGIDIVAPKIVNTLVNLVFLLVDTLVRAIPRFVDAGLRLITGILTGIGNNIGKIVDAGARIITEYINGISRALPGIADAGAKLVVNFVNSIANAIRGNQAAMEAAGRNLASAIIDGMVGGIGRGITSVVNAAKNMAKSALNAAKSFLGIASPSKEFHKVGEWSAEGAAEGFDDGTSGVEDSAENMGRQALKALKNALSDPGELLGAIDTEPTIRPVLDLSDIEKKAKSINDLISSPTVSADLSYERAGSISARTFADAQQVDGTASEQSLTSETNLTFIQNNNSPKALAAGTIYRNTKNQLSKIKEGVKN